MRVFSVSAASNHAVMAGFIPAIHVLARGKKDVDARDKPGHDEVDRWMP
jgi:hypothetical protein